MSGFLEDRGVGANEETSLLGCLYAINRRVEDPFAFDGDIMVDSHSIQGAR